MNRHWFYVAKHFALDFLIVALGFLAGAAYRFQEGGQWLDNYYLYLPAVGIGAFTLPCINYILGLYAPLRMEHAFANRFGRLAIAGAIMILIVIAVGYINFSARIGRGVMTASLVSLIALLGAHHFHIFRRSKKFRERVAFVVANDLDAREARVFKHFGRRHLEFAGVISACGYEFDDPDVVLGNIGGFEEIVRTQKIDRVLCTGAGMNSPAMREALCHMRYSGVPVASLASLCEEVYQFVPLELVTPEWLLGASEWPQMLYIRKLKRAFDIVASLAGLVLFSPIIISGIIAVAVTSKGPVFYRQVRSGRFGKPFTVFKLRSMQVDAEAGGAQWSSVKGDPRVTRVGKFLRKYRVDEIPQLLNVLRGEMSFVGPRPERPEFVEKLSEEIPLMSERLFVQPGLTGWAQVNYPYGASIEDARRKLEYDLYYMKHMSVFLDLFILLDTVWIVLRGGLGEQAATAHPLSNAIREHIHAEPEPDAS